MTPEISMLASLQHVTQWQASCVMITHEPYVQKQVAVVQFSNDVRVEVAPQYMPLDELKRQLDEMVRTCAGTHTSLRSVTQMCVRKGLFPVYTICDDVWPACVSRA